ncbi:MAG: hypothetical protein ABIH23_32225 [bacterium]
MAIGEKLQGDILKSNKPDDAQLVIRAEEDFNEARQARAPQAAIWRIDEKLYYQEFPVYKSPESQIRLHLPLAVIRTEMGIITDYMVGTDIVEDDPDDAFFADMMQHRKKNLEKKSKLNERLLTVIEQSLKYGNGLLMQEPVTHPEIMGEGDAGRQVVVLDGIRYQNLDLFTWFPDPNAISMDVVNDARYHIFAFPKPVGQVKRYLKQIEAHYGKKFEWEVKGEGNISDYRSFQSSNKDSEKGEYCLLKMKFSCDENDDPAQFPHGRLVVWLGEHLLYTEPITCQKVFMLKNYGDPNKLYGFSQSRLIMYLSFAMNDVMSGITDHIKKTGNPPAEIDARLWARLGKTVPSAGDHIPEQPGEFYKYVTIPGTSAAHLQFPNELKSLVEMITGTHDVIQGKRPTGITAAAAIRELQEAAIVAVRLKLKNPISPFVEEIGANEIEIIKKFDNKIIKIRGSDGAQTRWVLFDPINRYIKNDSGQMVVASDGTGGRTLSEAQMEINVVAAPVMPSGRLATEQVWTERYDKGLATPRQWVYGSTIENKDDYWEELEEWLGVKEEIEKRKQSNEALGQFREAVRTILKYQQVKGDVNYVMAIDQAAKILFAFPEITKSFEYSLLPVEIQRELTKVFVIPTTGDNQGGANEPTTGSNKEPVAAGAYSATAAAEA